MTIFLQKNINYSKNLLLNFLPIFKLARDSGIEPELLVQLNYEVTFKLTTLRRMTLKVNIIIYLCPAIRRIPHIYYYICDPTGTRTRTRYIKSVQLYQLSYEIKNVRLSELPPPRYKSRFEEVQCFTSQLYLPYIDYGHIYISSWFNDRLVCHTASKSSEYGIRTRDFHRDRVALYR